jgi:hypothetical protein
LTFKDGYTEEIAPIAFEDVMKLIPKIWWAEEAYAVACYG